MDTERYDIRPAHPADLPSLPHIERAAAALFRHTPYGHLAEDEPQTTEVDLEREHVWVAVDARDQPVAFAIAHRLDLSVHLHEVDVHPLHARQGLGRRLIEAVAQWARAQGVPALTLTTFQDVPWNGPYYTRLGFRTLDPETLSHDLRAIRQREQAGGLPMEHRICMQLDL